MSSLKSGALLSLSTGVTLEDLQRPGHRGETRDAAGYGAHADVVHNDDGNSPSRVALARKFAEETIAFQLARIRAAA